MEANSSGQDQFSNTNCQISIVNQD